MAARDQPGRFELIAARRQCREARSGAVILRRAVETLAILFGGAMLE
jgi:hypothetical protein